MKDKNGVELKLGNKVTDIHGNEGEYVNVSGTYAIKFNHKGQDTYAFTHKIIESQICIVEEK